MRVVFIHGFLGSAANWGPILHRLRQDPRSTSWELVAVDLLGHGRRSHTDQPITLKSIVDDLQSQIPDGPFVGVGHSFGLRPLLKLADRDPGRVHRIVAEDSSPALSRQGAEELTQIFRQTPVPFSSRELARAHLDATWGEGSKMSRFLLSNIREQSAEVHTWRFDAPKLAALLEESIEESLWTEWARYPGRVSMILGGSSSFVTAERLEECLAKRAGKALEVVKIAGAGHWVHSDQPAAFVEQLIGIIGQSN